MDGLKINILMEEVYLSSHVNKIYENILKEEQVDGKSVNIIKKVLKDLDLSSSFIFVFGTGIGTFMGPVTELLKNNSVTLSEYEIGLLLLTSFAVLIGHSMNEINILYEEVKRQGLFKYLKDVTNFVLNIKTLLITIGEKIGKTIHTLADVLGFTFMLVPSMNVIKELIVTNDITSETLIQLLAGLGASAATYTVKSVVDAVVDKLGEMK